MSSDKFKIRKLNPIKLFNALKMHYQQNLIQSRAFEERGQQKELFNKIDLAQLIKSKNPDKIKKLLTNKNQSYQERANKWKNFNLEMRKSLINGDDIANANLQLQDMA